MTDREQSPRYGRYSHQQSPTQRPQNTTDRRRCGRRILRGPLSSWVPNATVEAEGVGRQPVIVREVSLEGARFDACIALELKREIMLHVSVGARNLHIPCEVTHERHTGESVGERMFTHGCRFLFIQPGDAQALADAESLKQPG